VATFLKPVETIIEGRVEQIIGANPKDAQGLYWTS
jgi:hypothetical protein